MENSAPLDEKPRILKKIEDIGNRDFDGVDVTGILRGYLHATDPEIVLSALHAAGNYVADETLFQEIHAMAKSHGDEEIRAMANSCLGAVIQDGLEFEENLPPGLAVSAAQVSREFYGLIRAYLLEKVDAPMESMEVRRRALEALGYLGFDPAVRKIVLRFYHQAPNAYVKVSALYAMGLIRDAVFERLILEELYSTSEPILMEAIHSAAGLELHASEERLQTLSRSPSQDIRFEAIVALGTVAPISRLPEILNQLETAEQSQDVREAILMAKNSLKQRLMQGKGDPIWDDNLILSEIEDMVDNGEGPTGNNDRDR